ncbi:MAG TPA: methylmalonyl-CoA epimerase [Flavitalea sp.]|nr:methylmalonyl-CoA epimerase [Flavitalea sp.]
MNRVEHIGIAVKSLATSIPLFEKLLNRQHYKMETVESENVRTAFFFDGDTKLELLESLSTEGVISRFLSQRGEGIHHIAFEVNDIRSEMKRLAEEGFVLLDKEPRPGADNKMVCFLHPKSTNGLLIELVMTKP